MRPITVTKSLTALDRDGISLAQQLVGAGNLTITGALAAAGVATLDSQRRVGIYSAGDLHLTTFTVYGTDEQGRVISEAIAGPNNSTVSTSLDFKTVTRIAASAAVGTDVEAGTTGVGASSWIPPDIYAKDFQLGVAGEVTGTVNYTVQHTYDDVWDNAAVKVPFDNVILGGVAASGDSNYITPVTGVRLQINSGQGSVKMRIVQSSAS